jgi:hypothetical protein
MYYRVLHVESHSLRAPSLRPYIRDFRLEMEAGMNINDRSNRPCIHLKLRSLVDPDSGVQFNLFQLQIGIACRRSEVFLGNVTGGQARSHPMIEFCAWSRCGGVAEMTRIIVNCLLAGDLTCCMLAELKAHWRKDCLTPISHEGRGAIASCCVCTRLFNCGDSNNPVQSEVNTIEAQIRQEF